MVRNQKEPGKPRGKMSSYAFFVQICREEHKKKHPDESVVFAEFSKKCAEKWKAMNAKEKRRFEELAEKDKARYNSEMEHYVPPPGEGGKRKRKRTKDPNAPKRALSAFFFFCADARADVRKLYPTYGVGDVAKELGKRWEKCPNRPKYEAQALKDKQRYEKDMEVYKKTGKKPKVEVVVKPPPPPPTAAKEESDDDDDDEEDDEEDDDDDEDDDE